MSGPMDGVKISETSTIVDNPTHTMQDVDTDHSRTSYDRDGTSYLNLYQPLNEELEEIRVLTVFPHSKDSRVVECYMETVSLKSFISEGRDSSDLFYETCPTRNGRLECFSNEVNDETTRRYRYTWGDFAALSYVWGDSTCTRQIIVNDCIVDVPQNLEIALQALSSKSEFQAGFKIWIDAICINQKDLDERSVQIGKMKDIYGDASKVIAWLGDDAHASDQGMRLIEALAQVSRENWGNALVDRLETDPDFFGFGAWVGLHDLVNRDYFYRLWIIQELVLGSTRLVIRCGEEEMTWMTFCEGIGLLFECLWIIKDDLFRREVKSMGVQDQRNSSWMTSSLHMIHQDLWSLSLRKDSSKEFLSFPRLLDIAHFANSHDPRDRVYGLVGIMDPLIAKNITANYTAEPSRVFAATTQVFIETYRNLEPLREGSPWSRTNTPSWAADWTWNGRPLYTRPETVLWGGIWKHKGPYPINRDADPYRASHDEPATFSFSGNGMFLTCRGFIVDEVDGLGAHEVGYFDYALDSVVQPNSQKNAYGDAAAVEKALYTTLVADRVTTGKPADIRHKAMLSLPSTFAAALPQFKSRGWDWLTSQEGYYFRYEHWRASNKDLTVMSKPLNSYFTDVIPSDGAEVSYSEAYSSFDRTCKSRRFMTTAAGYIGWAPDNMTGDNFSQTRQGDLIAILYGCSTPLAIHRSYQGMFRVVGEAYVQGLMDGEALMRQKNGEFQVQDFTFH